MNVATNYSSTRSIATGKKEQILLKAVNCPVTIYFERKNGRNRNQKRQPTFQNDRKLLNHLHSNHKRSEDRT